MTVEQNIHQLVSKYVFQDTASGKLARFIIARYKKKSRVVHNLSYLDSKWVQLEKYSSEFRNCDDLLMALCFSKISASLFKVNHLKACLSRTDGLLGNLSIGKVQLNHIKKLITVASEPWQFQDESEYDLLLFKDIMLSRLAMPDADYKKFLDGIRAESAFVKTSVWKRKRLQRVNNLLALPKIFSTDRFTKLESLARENLEKEKANLLKKS